MPEVPDTESPLSVEDSCLPPEAIHHLTLPLQRFLRIEALAGAALLFFVLIALTVSNSNLAHTFFEFWEIPIGIQISSFESSRSLREWIRLMTP
jgi:Na+/H+ antiporter NhaA